MRLANRPGAPLFTQRLSRLIARTGIGTSDGLTLGRDARPLLSKLSYAMMEIPISIIESERLLQKKPQTPTGAREIPNRIPATIRTRFLTQTAATKRFLRMPLSLLISINGIWQRTKLYETK